MKSLSLILIEKQKEFDALKEILNFFPEVQYDEFANYLSLNVKYAKLATNFNISSNYFYPYFYFKNKKINIDYKTRLFDFCSPDSFNKASFIKFYPYDIILKEANFTDDLIRKLDIYLSENLSNYVNIDITSVPSRLRTYFILR